MNRRVIVVIVVVVAAVVGALLWRQHEQVTVVRSEQGSGSAAGTGSAAGSATPGKTGPHVTQIGRAERAKLAERIAAANAARSSAHGGVPAKPTLPDQGSDDPISRVKDHVMTALKEAIPFLSECYEQQFGDARVPITTMAMMTLTTDPDIGTVIDAEQILDDKQQPIPKALDDCLRNTMQTLALPPLDSEDTIKIQYSFRFD